MQQPGRVKEKVMAEKYGVVSASKIIGEAVVNRQNENLGKIHELVIDAKEGRLAYAVLSFGGFMGMGNKLFALPWRAESRSEIDCQVLARARMGKRFLTGTRTAHRSEEGDRP